MKQLKTILNKKLFFLFFVLGSVLSIQAQTIQTTPETFCQGTGIRHYAVDTSDGTNGTPGSTYTWSISGTTTATLSTSTGNPVTIDWTNTPAGSYVVHVIETTTATSCVASEVTLNVVITPKVTPLFTQVATICSGASLAALPTTSTNSISGTWSPAINNAATTVYTFTPTDAICNNSATMTITVTPKVTPLFTQVATICSGASLAALPTTSTNSLTGTWSPAINNTATTVYTFTPTDVICNNSATMTITVNTLPTTSAIYHD